MKLAAVLVAAMLLVTARPAEACFNVTQAEVDAQTKKVKAAEAALDAEDLPKAQKAAAEAVHFLALAKMVVQGEGTLRSPDNKPVNPPDPSLLRRAHRIQSLAASRAAKTASEREAAMKTFEKEVFTTTPEPALLADYGEILSRVPERAGQATMMLRMLSEKDLIGSARAYLALAKLEHAAGNADAEKNARERCRTSATKKAICET